MTARAVLLSVSVLAFSVATTTADNHLEQPSSWHRVKRVAAYKSPRRARYPSITTAKDGSLLVLLTKQTADEETAGHGSLVLVRSTDGGTTWSDGRTVYRGTYGQPRARGTLTRLQSGRIIAPFVELGEDTHTARMLSSTDNGNNWQVNELDATLPFAWWTPSGKVLESSDGHLTMPVYGAVSEADLRSTMHNCGLLRSKDNGKTWGDFSWIARGSGLVVGTAENIRFSFEGPEVQPLADGRWLAVVTARRLNRTANGPSVPNEGPGSPQILCRLWSTDLGRTWTAPNQLMPGAWAAIAVAGSHTVCANGAWGAWGVMRLDVSRNGFESIFQELPLMNRGWLSGRANNPDEAPLPPTVPHLSDGWKFEHYGFPSIEVLDDQNMIVAFARTQRGTPSYHEFDPPELDAIPVEMEKIQTVFYRRSQVVEKLADVTAAPPQPHGRWVLSERIVVPDLTGTMAQLAGGDLIAEAGGNLRRSDDGGRTWHEVPGATLPGDGPVAAVRGTLAALGGLRNGRWLTATIKVNQQWRGGGYNVIGVDGGYPLNGSRNNQSYDAEIIVHHSDDEGKTWQASKPFKGPFLWAIPTVSHFIESDDGTIALPIFGCVTQEEMRSYSSSNGVIRSHDHGRTWGDFSFVFRTKPKVSGENQPEPRYSEMDIIELANGHWVAFSRNERIAAGPQGQGVTSVAVSIDQGRTWTQTGGSLVGVSQQKGVALPDGGIALTYRSHSWQQPGVAISYDEGRTFSYMLGGPYETVNSFLTAPDQFIVFTAKSHRSDMAAAVYRLRQ